MSDHGNSSDTLEEIDDPSELLSKPLEPVPLVRPSSIDQPPASPPKKRQLPPGFGTGASSGSSSSTSRPTVWQPPRQHAQAAVPAAENPATLAGNGLIIGGSGARVPTQFLDANGGFSRQAPPTAAGSASSVHVPTPSMPGAFPLAAASAVAPTPQQSSAPRPSRVETTIDLTFDSDEEDDKDKPVISRSNGNAIASGSSMPSTAHTAQALVNGGSAPKAEHAASSSSPGPSAPIDIDDDDDEPVLVGLKRPAPEEFEIDHVKSNAIVCAGLIHAVVLCMYGLPPALTYAGNAGQEPPQDPNFTRENWPNASRFWTEQGYRPVMLHLPDPNSLPPSSRTLPGGWSYIAMPPQRADINVSVLVPPLARYPHLPREQAFAQGPYVEQAFGSLAEKYVTPMEPLLRSNKIRCEARCRLVPIGRAQNFLQYLEILVFACRPDLPLISERLASQGIQLEHPPSYHPEDYPTQPQYTNPHNPPAGGMRNDHMLNTYNGIYRGAGMGTSVQNREMTEKEKKAQVDAIYTSIRSGEELAAVEPTELISTRLLQHQKQALGFLLNRERDRRWTELLVERKEDQKKEEGGDSSSAPKEPKFELVKAEGKSKASTSSSASEKGKAKDKVQEEVDEDSISLWKVHKGMNGKVRAWRNLITNRETMAQPRICRGSILADDMGLGKTITTLALMAHTLREAKAFGASKVPREAGIDLAEAMQANGVSDEEGASKAKVESFSNGKGKGKAGAKRRSSESSFDDDMNFDDKFDLSDLSDDDVTPPISLALHNAPPAAKNTTANGKKKAKEKTDPEIVRRKHLERRTRATLIVCPLSVISNWEEQIKEHWARKKRPSVYIYHGPSRSNSVKWIANHDIVLTTYSTLGSEFSNQSTWVTDDVRDPKKGKKGGSSDDEHAVDDDDEVFMVNENGIPIGDQAGGGKTDKNNGKKRKRKAAKESLNPLQHIEWFRVVLDEAHIIKGAGTWQSKAVCNLSAQRRLCLTGTPIQNTINDLFALVKFLRLEPFTDRAIWNEFCGHKESHGLKSKGKDDEPIDPANLGHVQILMKFLALRRQKITKTADGKQLLTLPPKLSKTEYLDFEETEKARYQALHNRYREEFEEMMAGDTVNNNYATILHEILNLRMTCDHPSMVDAGKDAKRMSAGADLSEAIKQDGLSRERAAILFILFRDSEMAYCSECQSDLSMSADRGGAGNDAQELVDALDDVAGEAGNGKRKRTRIEPGMASIASSTIMSRDGLETPREGAARPVVTRCQHMFCSSCFRRLIGFPWPNVTAPDVGNCPTCSYSLNLAMDAIELDPTDFLGINDDQAERVADGDQDFIDPNDDEDADDNKFKINKYDDEGVDEPESDFDWGSGDEDSKIKTHRRKAPRNHGSGSTEIRGDISLEGRKDLSTKIRALITDLLPFSKCNPHSALYDPTAPRLVHIEPSTSEDPEVRKVEDPVVVIQKPPAAITKSGLLGKLDQAMDALDSYDPVKSVVFSQWTKMLDRIQKSLKITGIRVARLDGTMKRSDRSAALESFKNNPTIEVLLVSLRAGGTGLNLVSACRAYLMDPYWNPAVENQGLDRVHRMGQTRPVITTKYIMRHSIEENMLRLQKRKMMLAEKVGSKRQIGAGARREERREDLRVLFGTSNGGVESVEKRSSV